MKLIIGLGNIGDKYLRTRHNIGFMCLDNLAEAYRKSFSKSELYDYLVIKEAVLIKPNTYMNCSGLALQAAFHKWKPTDYLVVYDDIELNIAELRFRSGGGDGGHNGIKSLLEYIDPDSLKRIRIGIGRNQAERAENYVLAKIPEEDMPKYDEVFKLTSKFFKTYIARDFSSMLDEYSKWKKTYSGKSEAGIISPKED
jgi:PTH1 family peptidyl-tRNA hydrolase